MKLRNKKTGEIREIPDGFFCGDNLKKVCEKWEDYEESKEYWYVSAYGNLAKTDVMTSLHRGAEEIGNLFDTREEAEEAIEKLKAWKRLKDKGFRFDGYNSDFEGYWVIYPNDTEGTWRLAQDKADLDLLFGGEE